MQEQNDVADERVRNLGALVDLEVIPHALVTKPKEHAASGKNPERASTARRGPSRCDIGQKCRRRQQEQSALDPVARNGQSISPWHYEGCNNLCEHEKRE